MLALTNFHSFYLGLLKLTQYLYGSSLFYLNFVAILSHLMFVLDFIDVGD